MQRPVRETSPAGAVCACRVAKPRSGCVLADQTDAISEIVFIDPDVQDIETLLDGLRPEVAPVLLDQVRPAPEQIAAALADHSDLDGIHIIAHGAPGEVRFAAGRLYSENIGMHRA